MASSRTVASCVANGSTNIPVRRTLSRSSSGSSSPINKQVLQNGEEKNRWKQKYDEAEQKRKLLLAQNEKTSRSYNELEKKYNNLLVKQEEMETELFEKNESLTKLTTVSRNLFQEYDTLKKQYETEIGALQGALNDASHWYRENKVLRRRTMLLDKDTVDEGVDAGETNDSLDLENLRESVKQLSSEVAHLQSELNAVKLQEFETSELNSNLSQELENEREKSAKLESELKSLKEEHEQTLRVSNLMRRELEELKKSEQHQRDNAITMRKKADDYKRERNVLAHQSTLLLQGIEDNENSGEYVRLLQEIEELKRTLEDERNRYNAELSTLQEKLEEQENNSHTEILEERLKIVESELEQAKERAEKAEKALAAASAAVPPLPPPPPPPPPLPATNQPPCAPVRTKRLSRTNVSDIVATLGVEVKPPDTTKKAIGVNSEIINQIKDGNFTLRKAKSDNKKERETPKAVTELLNILGSLRRAPKNRMSISQNLADVQL